MSPGSGSRGIGGRMAVLASLVLLALPAAAARGASPTVVTGKATEITQTSVRLTGTVNPNGSPTRYFFSMGGNRISHDAGSGTSPVTVSLLVTGLLPGTIYSYTLNALDSNGFTTNGQTLSFSTLSPPCRVPRLKGQYLAVASLRLSEAGCQLGKVRYRRLGHGFQRILNRLRARVVSQSPRAGRRVPHGTKVTLVLAPRG